MGSKGITKIHQGNIFGRIGTGIGKGLAEQVPKEIERNRLAAGLQNFENEHQNLSPVQQLARLSSIPGITPQMIQSFAELAKQGNQGNAYRNLAGQGRGVSTPRSADALTNQETGQPQRQSIPGQNIPQPNEGIGQGTGQTQPENLPGRTSIVNPNEPSPPQIVNENPLNERNLTRGPWTPNEKAEAIGYYLDQGFTLPDAERLATDAENRDLAQPAANRERLEQKQALQKQARDELTRQLDMKIQKSGTEQFAPLTGEMLGNIQRGMEKDLRLNPNATLSDVANDWSNRALEMAKTKNKLETLGKTTGIENLFKGDQTYNKLKTYSDTFRKAGNSEEYYNLLQSNFGLSPQGAASVAYPLSKDVKKYVDNFKITPSKSFDLNKIEDNSRRAAHEIAKSIKQDDSILSIARSLSQRDPTFNQEVFFEQLDFEKNDQGFNPRQIDEISEGTRDILPNWGDLLILPWSKK